MTENNKIKLEEYLREDTYWIDRAKEMYIEGVFRDSTAIQNIHTPNDLCKEIVSKLKENCIIEGRTILTLNPEFVNILGNDENITFVSDCPKKSKYVRGFFPKVKVVEEDFLKMENNMKFDAIVGNPPYQSKSDSSNTKTQAIWDKFVTKSVALCKDNGYIALIHPSGWRSCGKIFEDAKIIKEKQIEYLEIHGEQDGLKTFGATTRYDWYVLKNCKPTHKAVVVDQDNVSSKIDISTLPFIPNTMIEKVLSMMAKDNESRVNVLHSFSAYESRKPYISKDKSSKHCYPIVYSTPIESPTVWYSSTNQNGHFGISKIILNPGRPIGFVVDYDGQYGMSQFCVGITGDKKHLDMVANVIKNQKTNGFAEFMEACHFTDKIFNKDVISSLRNDFWEEFCS